MRYLVLFAIVLSVMTGCNNTQNEASPPQPNNDQQAANRYDVRVQQTVPAKREITNKEAVADRLERLANGIGQVNNTTCVVIGNTAVCGIDVDGKLDRSRVGTIKYSVAEAFRKDPHGVHALVTADMDLVQRIRKIGKHIDNGRPVSGFAQELADIVGRIIPQMPRDAGPTPEPRAESEDSGELQRNGL
jgi:YhcN/YlaJ family sporulation lipoprotein